MSYKKLSIYKGKNFKSDKYGFKELFGKLNTIARCPKCNFSKPTPEALKNEL